MKSLTGGSTILNSDIIDIIFEYRGYKFTCDNEMNESQILTLINICGTNSNKIKIKIFKIWNCNTDDHESILFYCCKNGFYTPVSILLSLRYVDINGGTCKNERNYFNTPLHESVHIWFCDIIQILLKHGADVNIINSDGLTPFVLVLDNILFNVDGIEQYKMIATKILDYDFNPDVQGRDANTQLMEALICENECKQIGNDISTKILKLYPNADLDIKNVDEDCAQNYLDN